MMNQNIKNFCLIITGTINPVKQNFCALNDSNERKKQYLECIEYFIKSSSLVNIVYCDNSNTHISEEKKLIELAKKMRKSFEWIAFAGDNATVSRLNNKGYGEGEILDYVMDHSEIAKSADAIVKITGRLIVKNFNEILENTKTSKSYFNRDIYHGRKCLDTRFYIINKQTFVEHCYHINKKMLTTNEPIEHLYYKSLPRGGYKCLPRFPDIYGMSGATGKNYEDSEKPINFYNFLCKNWIFNVAYPIIMAPRKVRTMIWKKYR